MATNTFGSVIPMQLKPRNPASATLRMIGIQGGANVNILPYLSWDNPKGITGWIRNISSTPRQRRIDLHVMPAGNLIATVISDPANGGNNYFFNNLLDLTNTGDTYCIVAHSIDGTTAPEVKDQLQPA